LREAFVDQPLGATVAAELEVTIEPQQGLREAVVRGRRRVWLAT
jgi:hypothetical protein